MTGFDIVIILVCAGLGFGIVNNMFNTARKPDPPRNDDPDDHSAP